MVARRQSQKCLGFRRAYLLLGTEAKKERPREGKGELEMVPPKPKPSTYSWIIGPISRKLYCFRSSAADQIVSKFWEAEEPTSYHDAELANATREINTVL